MRHFPKDTVFLDHTDSTHAKIMLVLGYSPHPVLEGVWVATDKSGDEIDARNEQIPLYKAVSHAHKRILSIQEANRIKASRALLLPLLGLEIVETNLRGDEAIQVKDVNELTYDFREY